ncbi:hypothetical protein EV183_000592 [Coemansia sp. RSA 2336]|nr:hypothetical protein EV183_000592 [Coemansia sp. RSA 2336]
MAEVVAYEDSPLGQYLQEIDAAETLVVDDKANGLPKTESDSGYQDVSVFRRLILWTRSTSQTNHLLTELWQETIAILASSGHMAERYTPMKTYWSAGNSHKYLGTDNPAKSVVKQTLPLGIASAFVLWTSRLAKSRLFITRAVPSKLGLAIGTTAVTAILSAHRAWNQFKVRKLANSFIDQLESMVHNCRVLDSTIHSALCFIQEVEFVQRGFRLTQQYKTSVTQRLGYGSLLMAQHLRQTLNTELSQLLQTHLDELPVNSDTNEELAGIANEAKNAMKVYSDEDLTLEVLRSKFALLFALRRAWFEFMVDSISPENIASSPQPSVSAVVPMLMKLIRQLDEAATKSTESIKQAREGQHTANRWAMLANPDDAASIPSQPLARSLENMTQVLDTIKAKLVVCQECIHNATHMEDTDNVARLFTSLKADIDMLGVHYQQSVNVLLNVDSEENVDLDSDAKVYEDVPDMVSENTHIFTYTPTTANDLDAPAMTFESEANTEQSGAHQRERPALSRMERIRIQRQNRVDEEAARQRKHDVFSMLDELKSAIDTRANESQKDA